MKLKEYDANYIGMEIDKHNVENLTGITFDALCELTGMFHSSFLSKMISKKWFFLKGVYPEFSIKAVVPNILRIDMEFNLFHRTILVSNLQFAPDLQRKKLARNAFQKQLELATKIGFKEIQCWAFKGTEVKYKKRWFNGYLIWPKFGFTMRGKDRKDFSTLMNTSGRKEKCVQKLICTTEGFEFWETNGKTWKGYFDLKEKSINRCIWKRYLERKFY